MCCTPILGTTPADNELIMAVVCKFPDETRHQTALRYIQERENQEVATAKKDK